MTKAETITKFELYMDDTSELSSVEVGALYDKIVYIISDNRPWEVLKSPHSGTTDGTVNVALPSDFAYLTQNDNYTDSSYAAERPVVYVGTNNKEYQVVSWSDRRNYRDQDNICWIDIANSNLVFAVAPSSGQAIEFDYITIPEVTADGASSWIPTRFDPVIYHGMCVDDFVIQQSEKAKSYAGENERMFKDYISSMALWNSNLIQQ